MLKQESLTLATRGRGMYDLTDRIQRIVGNSGLVAGLCHVFLHHTSASLLLCENADSAVLRDLEAFMGRLVADGDPRFEHDSEGPDDMPAHIRTVLTHSDLTVPVVAGRCSLGTWQGIYLWEHRREGVTRKITITLQGE